LILPLGAPLTVSASLSDQLHGRGNAHAGLRGEQRGGFDRNGAQSQQTGAGSDNPHLRASGVLGATDSKKNPTMLEEAERMTSGPLSTARHSLGGDRERMVGATGKISAEKLRPIVSVPVMEVLCCPVG